MKITARMLLPTLLLGASVALAAETPTRAPAGDPAAQDVKTINVGFRGSLRDALKRIAEDGGINVVATGDLDTSVEVHLKGVTAEQALRTIARTYSLRLDQDGSIFTLRPMTAAEKEAAPSSVAASTPAPAPEAAPAGVPPMPAMPPIPPMGIAPPAPPAPPALSESSEDEVDPSEIRDRVRREVRKTQRRNKGERDVVARGHSLEVKENDSVHNAVVYGGNLVVKGHVEEDAVAFSGNLDVYGTVEGDASAFNGNVILHPGSAVMGDVSAIGGTVVRNDDTHVEGAIESFGGGNVGKVVAGQVKDTLKKEFRKKDADTEEAQEEEERGGGLPWFFIKFAALFGLGFLGQLFFPTRMKELSAELKAQPVKSAMVGFLGAVALVPISLVLMITIIGIPVAAALLLVAALAAVLGFTAVASEIGLRVPIMRGRKTQAVVLALGLLILLTLTSLPVLGWLVAIPASLMGFGAALLTRFGNRLRGFPEPLSRTTIGV